MLRLQILPLFSVSILQCNRGSQNPHLSCPSTALLGLLFSDQKEAAFGNLCFWQSVGFAGVAALGVPQSVCAGHVIVVTMVVLVTVIGMCCVLEFRTRNDIQLPDRAHYVAAKNEDCDEKCDSLNQKTQNMATRV